MRYIKAMSQQTLSLLLAVYIGWFMNFSVLSRRFEGYLQDFSFEKGLFIVIELVGTLLVTFFWRQMPRLIEKGHLYLAVPPLYRLQHGGKSVYARNDAHKDELLETVFKGKKPEISRFKGLGEMMPAQLKETTMDPKKRILLKVMVDHEAKQETSDTVERLMGNKPEARFSFIQERAAFAGELIDL